MLLVRILLCFFLVLLHWTQVMAQQDSIIYSFFAAGHTSGKSGVNNVGLHPPFKSKFSLINNHSTIELGILTGDIVDANPTAVDWDEVDTDLDSLHMPVYFAAGNHDMEDRALYESRYGDTYYSFIHQNDLFIVLDPNLDHWNISEEQLTFVRNTVKKNTWQVNNIHVFFHQLLWITSHNIFKHVRINSFEGRAPVINFWDELLPIFHSISNQVYFFAGDMGAGSWSDDAMYYNFDHITFVGSGMGEGPGDNFVIANIWSGDSVTFDLVPLHENDSASLGKLEDHAVEGEPDIILSIAPNPVVDYAVIGIDHIESFEQIELFHLNGQLIKSLKNSSKYLDLADVPKGIYFLRAEHKGTIYFSWLVKQ